MNQVPVPKMVDSNKGNRLLLIILVLAIVCIIGPFYYLSKAKVSGVEFNPTSWQVRDFDFYADPFTGYQITGVDHPTPTLTIDPLITGKLSNKVAANPDRWDLVELKDFHSQASHGPAKILVDLLTHQIGSSGSMEYFNTWSANNPTQATKIWQAAQILTIHECYYRTPDLLELTYVNRDQFDRLVDELMADTLLHQAKRFSETGKSAAATAAARDGLLFRPDDSELQGLANTTTP